MNPHRLLLLAIALGFFNLINFAFLPLLYVLGRPLLRRPVNRIIIFAGPTLFRFPVRGIIVHVKLVPLGASLSFGPPPGSTDLSGELPFTRSFLLALLPPVASLAVGLAFLGPAAITSAATGVVQMVMGAANPAQTGRQLLASFFALLDHHDFASAVGVLSSKMVVVYLLHLPPLILQAMTTSLTGRTSAKARARGFWETPLIVIYLCLFGAWFLALASWLHRG